jgi:cob(I)alamin adenosyltransferase
VYNTLSKMKEERIYTRGGDAGETGLFLGGRVSKADPRIEASGALDEAVSVMGLARSLSQDQRISELLTALQKRLLALCSEILVDTQRRHEFLERYRPLEAAETRELEATIDALSEEVGPVREFVIPGGSPASAALDMARAVVRRAERRAVVVAEGGLLENAEIIRYLNRLSDLLFVMARYEERHQAH